MSYPYWSNIGPPFCANRVSLSRGLIWTFASLDLTVWHNGRTMSPHNTPVFNCYACQIEMFFVTQITANLFIFVSINLSLILEYWPWQKILAALILFRISYSYFHHWIQLKNLICLAISYHEYSKNKSDTKIKRFPRHTFNNCFRRMKDFSSMRNATKRALLNLF